MQKKNPFSEKEKSHSVIFCLINTHSNYANVILKRITFLVGLIITITLLQPVTESSGDRNEISIIYVC